MPDDILGLTPSPLNDSTLANGASAAITGTSTAYAAFPTKSGPGPQANVDGGTSAGVTRYPRKMILTAIGTAICVRFGGSGVAAAVTSDHVIPLNQQHVVIRQPGWTGYRAISEDGSSTGRLKISVLTWEKQKID